MGDVTTEPRKHWPSWLTADAAWFSAASLGAAAVAAFGFALSFTRLGAGARADGLHPWWLLPLSIDAPILVFVVADHYLVSRGYRSLFARGCAWGFAVLTVALNVAAPESGLWHWARVAAPAAWILGIEAVRRMWKAYRLGARPAADRAPVTEWLGAPCRTLAVWRRKLALGVPGWSDMRHLEEARLLVADLAIAREDAGQPVPAAVARTVRTGWFPAALAEAVTGTPAAEWEPLVTAWAARQMALPETLLRAVTDAAPSAPETVAERASEPAPGSASQARTERVPAALPKLTAKRARSMTPSALVPWATALLETDPDPSLRRAMTTLHAGKEKATEALRLARKERLQAVAAK